MVAEDVHIRLDRPKGLQKDLLESALSSSEFLQTIDRIQTFEQERLLLKTEFQRSITDLSIAMDQFVKSIPPIPMEFIQKQQQVMQRAVLQQRPLKVLTPRQEMASRMQPKEQEPLTPAFKNPLEEEIDELKRRIQSLSI